jgi:iron complex transport system substrate-binding protein
VTVVLGLAGCSLPMPDNSNDSGVLFPYFDRDNCGVTVKYDLAPIRAATLTPGATDLLGALGVSNRVVATDLGPDFARIRATNSDFVYAGTMSGMTGRVPDQDPIAGGIALRDGLKRYDHPTHVSVLYCPGHMQNLDTVYLEVTIIGDIFGVPEAAAKLVDDWRGEFDQLTERVRGLRRPNVAIVDARVGRPMLAGPGSLAQTLVTFAGGANVATGSGQWLASDWAAIKDAQPDLVVLVDGSKAPTDPFLAKKVKRLNGLDDGLFEAGPKVPEVARRLAAIFHPDQF